MLVLGFEPNLNGNAGLFRDQQGRRLYCCDERHGPGGAKFLYLRAEMAVYTIPDPVWLS